MIHVVASLPRAHALETVEIMQVGRLNRNVASATVALGHARAAVAGHAHPLAVGAEPCVEPVGLGNLSKCALAAANLVQADVIVDISQQGNRLLHANNGAPRPLTVDQALLDARPDLVARVLARTMAAGRWAEAHPVETTAYIARETKSPELWVRHAYGPKLHHSLHIDLAPDSVAALDNFKQFLHGSGYLPTDFDIEQWIDPQPLRQALQLLDARRDNISAELAA